MAWFRVRLTEEEQRVVNEERCCHPNLRIREKMLVLWLLHTGLTRQQAAKAAGVSRVRLPSRQSLRRRSGRCWGSPSMSSIDVVSRLPWRWKYLSSLVL